MNRTGDKPGYELLGCGGGSFLSISISIYSSGVDRSLGRWWCSDLFIKTYGAGVDRCLGRWWGSNLSVNIYVSGVDKCWGGGGGALIYLLISMVQE